MKRLLPLLLLSVLAVSCGNKNSSGGSHSSSNPYSTGDSNFDAMSIEEEQNFGASYLRVANEILKARQKQIIARYGQYNYDIIRDRLNSLQVNISYPIIYDMDSGKNIASFYDGYTMMLYVGNDIPKLNWRKNLSSSEGKERIYEDLLTLRTNGGYRASNRFYKTRSNSGSTRGGGASFHYEYSTRN